jgi:hypothetical protein
VADGVLEFKSKTRTLRVPLSRQALALLDPNSPDKLLHVGDTQLRKPLIRIFGERETARGKRPRVTPHDLRRLFKSAGAELGIDPVILNLLVGHTVKGVDKHYLAKLRISVLRAAAQRIADEIDNPRELAEGDGAIEVAETAGHDIPLESVESYLPSLEDLVPTRHAHYLKREDLHKLVWTAPVSEIASRIGKCCSSIRGQRKLRACRSHGELSRAGDANVHCLAATWCGAHPTGHSQLERSGLITTAIGMQMRKRKRGMRLAMGLRCSTLSWMLVITHA